MDFDGFLVQLRIAVDDVERAAAPLSAAVPAATREVPDGTAVRQRQRTSGAPELDPAP